MYADMTVFSQDTIFLTVGRGGHLIFQWNTSICRFSALTEGQIRVLSRLECCPNSHFEDFVIAQHRFSKIANFFEESEHLPLNPAKVQVDSF
jgi:hypothetical protein